MVKISMDTFVKRFQPDKYEDWINGTDIGPHPEDPVTEAAAAPLPTDQDILVNKNNVNVPEPVIKSLKKKCNPSLKSKTFKERNPDLDMDEIQNNPYIPDDIKAYLSGSVLDEEEGNDDSAACIKNGDALKPEKFDDIFNEDSDEEIARPRRKRKGKKEDDDWFATKAERIKQEKISNPKPRGRPKRKSDEGVESKPTKQKKQTRRKKDEATKKPTDSPKTQPAKSKVTKKPPALPFTLLDLSKKFEGKIPSLKNNTQTQCNDAVKKVVVEPAYPKLNLDIISPVKSSPSHSPVEKVSQARKSPPSTVTSSSSPNNLLRLPLHNALSLGPLCSRSTLSDMISASTDVKTCEIAPRNTISHHSIPPPPYIPPKRPAPDTSRAPGDYLGAFNKFIEQNVKKNVEANSKLDKCIDEQIKKNIENLLKNNANAELAKQEKSYSSATRIQSDNLSRKERNNVNISTLSTIPLYPNIKSIRPIYSAPTQSQSSLMQSSSLKALPALMISPSTKSNNPMNPSTPPVILNYATQDMANVTNKNKSVTPINYNEQLLSNLVQSEMISKYSTPTTTSATGAPYNNLQLLYQHTEYEKLHQNAVYPPQTQIQATVPQQHQYQKKYHHEQTQKVPQEHQKYILNTSTGSTEHYSSNYPRNFKADQTQSTVATTYRNSSPQDKTLLSEPCAPISELNTSISQAFVYNHILNLKASNLLPNRFLGVSSEDN